MTTSTFVHVPGKPKHQPTLERQVRSLPGWLVLLPALLITGYVMWFLIDNATSRGGPQPAGHLGGEAYGLTAVFTMFLFFFHCRGYFVVEPNMARVLILFGKYQGTVRSSGFWYTNPFANKRRISLRARNLDGSTLKVNDLLGNPVEISAVVVWQVEETAHATFDVDDYEHYVNVQSEAAVRNLAMTLPYDNLEEEGHSTTLRGSTDQVGQLLEEELRTRLASAGVHVIEARLKHLAYAPEIAHAMLQRQQAKAIIAARRQIVEGAVGMVEMALRQLSEDKIVELRDEDRAKLVGNLLVVLCSQSNAQPVLNTGNG